jgi:hypothetical protein
MVRAGVWLNLLTIILVVTWMQLFGLRIFEIK